MRNARAASRGTTRWWTVVLAVVAACCAAAPGVAGAQEQKGEAPAAPPAAEAAPAPGQPEAAPPTQADTEQIEQRSFLSWMIDASGLFGLVLLLLSFCMVALIVMNVLQVRRENFIPAEFVEQFESHLKEKRYQEAYDSARNSPSFLARVLAAGLPKLSTGYGQAVESMQEVGEEENMTLEHRLSYLALIGTVSPMIGLMGTVYGMIASFRVIASSSVTPKPNDLADGISTALFTTLEGLVVAIPAIAAYGILRNRVARLVLEVGIVSENLMSRFSGVGRRGGAASAAGGAASSTGAGTSR
ncbi:MAG: MotA/TolQ/ExbB proton channel family protein [Pirellulales bacterium]